MVVVIKTWTSVPSLLVGSCRRPLSDLSPSRLSLNLSVFTRPDSRGSGQNVQRIDPGFNIPPIDPLRWTSLLMGLGCGPSSAWHAVTLTHVAALAVYLDVGGLRTSASGS